jgi:hypothetical protein
MRATATMYNPVAFGLVGRSGVAAGDGRLRDDIMGMAQKIGHELKVVFWTTAYFAVWFGSLMLLKKLILAEYDVSAGRMSLALVGALVVAKVLLVLEAVPLGGWIRRRPAWLEMVVRTILYGIGVFIVLLIEKSIEQRHAYDGIEHAMAHLVEHAHMQHVIASTICVVGAILGFNALSVLRRSIGTDALVQAFLQPMPEKKRG